MSIDPRQVKEVGGQPAEPPRLRVRALHQRTGVLEIGFLVPQILAEQLQHPIKRRQRRSELMRRRGHERAPRLLLLEQPVLHGSERPRQIADLVTGPVDRHLHGGTLARQLQRRLA